MIGHAILALAAMAITAGGAIAEVALPKPGSSMILVGPGKPLAAWKAFCESYGPECAVDTAQPKAIVLTLAVWGMVNRLNRAVNAKLIPTTDVEHHGVHDLWDLAEDGKGDAEDYALLKRKRQADLGLPRRAMRNTIVIDEKGEGHAVLTLATDRGDIILDTKTSEVMAWALTGYVFIKRESQDAQEWVSMGGATH